MSEQSQVEKIFALEEKVKKLELEIQDYRFRIKYYENDGVSKLFYALNRKSSELADILNKNNLANLDIADPKDKTFDRVKIAWNEAATIANAVDSLSKIAVPSGDETKDTNTPKYRTPLTAEQIADESGSVAGQRQQ